VAQARSPTLRLKYAHRRAALPEKRRMSFEILTLKSIRARPVVLKLNRPVVERIATLTDWPACSGRT
jgi:hypothetical protein